MLMLRRVSILDWMGQGIVGSERLEWEDGVLRALLMDLMDGWKSR